jgi:hypothetical protein
MFERTLRAGRGTPGARAGPMQAGAATAAAHGNSGL